MFIRRTIATLVAAAALIGCGVAPNEQVGSTLPAPTTSVTTAPASTAPTILGEATPAAAGPSAQVEPVATSEDGTPQAPPIAQPPAQPAPIPQASPTTMQPPADIAPGATAGRGSAVQVTPTQPPPSAGVPLPTQPPTTAAPQPTGGILLSSTGTTMTAASLRATLNDLTVMAEPARSGYNRDLFPHWADVNGSGCTARQDALLAQVLGLPQRDPFGPCTIVEGDWFSLFDDVLYGGSPSELDADHVVALAEAWDAGAPGWTTEQRRQFANDPMNILIVTASSNRSKGDKDMGEWRPSNRRSWCVSAAMVILTKSRWNLAVDPTEKAALDQMAGACSEPDQLAVPGLPLPGTPAGAALLPVTPPPPPNPNPNPTTPPPTTAPPVTGGNCTSGQVNLNTASHPALQAIIHIGPDRATSIINGRPWSSVSSLTQISGIGPARIADIQAQGLACV
jgi:DNA uptake protein ComE-like DNA-binding protein